MPNSRVEEKLLKLTDRSLAIALVELKRAEALFADVVLGRETVTTEAQRIQQANVQSEALTKYLAKVRPVFSANEYPRRNPHARTVRRSGQSPARVSSAPRWLPSDPGLRADLLGIRMVQGLSAEARAASVIIEQSSPLLVGKLDKIRHVIEVGSSELTSRLAEPFLRERLASLRGSAPHLLSFDEAVAELVEEGVTHGLGVKTDISALSVTRSAPSLSIYAPIR